MAFTQGKAHQEAKTQELPHLSNQGMGMWTSVFKGLPGPWPGSSVG